MPDVIAYLGNFLLAKYIKFKLIEVKYCNFKWGDEGGRNFFRKKNFAREVFKPLSFLFSTPLLKVTCVIA